MEDITTSTAPRKLTSTPPLAYTSPSRLYNADNYVSSLNLYLRDAMLARYLPSSCVCPPVRPSQVGVLLRRLNPVLRKQRRTIKQAI